MAGLGANGGLGQVSRAEQPAALSELPTISSVLSTPLEVVSARVRNRKEGELFLQVGDVARSLEAAVNLYEDFAVRSHNLKKAWDGLWLANEPFLMPAVPLIAQAMSQHNIGRATLLERLELDLGVLCCLEAALLQFAEVNASLAKELQAEGVTQLAADKLLLSHIEQEVSNRISTLRAGAGISNFSSLAETISDLERNLRASPRSPLKTGSEEAPPTAKEGTLGDTQQGGSVGMGLLNKDKQIDKQQEQDEVKGGQKRKVDETNEGSRKSARTANEEHSTLAAGLVLKGAAGGIESHKGEHHMPSVSHSTETPEDLRGHAQHSNSQSEEKKVTEPRATDGTAPNRVESERGAKEKPQEVGGKGDKGVEVERAEGSGPAEGEGFDNGESQPRNDCPRDPRTLFLTSPLSPALLHLRLSTSSSSPDKSPPGTKGQVANMDSSSPANSSQPLPNADINEHKQIGHVTGQSEVHITEHSHTSNCIMKLPASTVPIISTGLELSSRESNGQQSAALTCTTSGTKTLPPADGCPEGQLKLADSNSEPVKVSGWTFSSDELFRPQKPTMSSQSGGTLILDIEGNNCCPLSQDLGEETSLQSQAVPVK